MGLVLIFFLSSTGVASIYKGVVRDDLNQSRLFDFVREEREMGHTTEIDSVYKDLQDHPVLLEKTFYENNKAWRYDLDQRQENATGSFEIVGREILFSYKKGGVQKTKSEALTDDFIAIDEVRTLIKRNYERLLSGDVVKFRLPVVERLETVGFKIFKDREQNEKVVFKMKPSSFFVSLFVPPFYFYIDKAKLELLKIEGLVQPKRKSGSDWKYFSAVLEPTSEAAIKGPSLVNRQ